MRISDWISDVRSSDLGIGRMVRIAGHTDRAVPGRAAHHQTTAYPAIGAGGAGLAGNALQHGGQALRCSRSARASWMRSPSSRTAIRWVRSEEHTSELQSLMRISYAVFCLKKKKTTITHTSTYYFD